jgi:hypothetical protein
MTDTHFPSTNLHKEKIKVKFYLYITKYEDISYVSFIKYHARKMYGGLEVKLHELT